MPDIYISSTTLGLSEISTFPSFLLENSLKLETSSLCKFSPSDSYPPNHSQIFILFPSSPNDFALNLASINSETFSLSREHVINTIRLSNKYNSSHYSFHSGFAIDLTPDMFGNAISGNVYDKRDSIFSQFCSNVKYYEPLPLHMEYDFLAENNVLGQTNFNRGYKDALFCVESDEILNFLDICSLTLRPSP